MFVFLTFELEELLKAKEEERKNDFAKAVYAIVHLCKCYLYATFCIRNQRAKLVRIFSHSIALDMIYISSSA